MPEAYLWRSHPGVRRLGAAASALAEVRRWDATGVSREESREAEN